MKTIEAPHFLENEQPTIGFSMLIQSQAPTVADGANILMVANKTYSVVDIDWSVQMNNTAAP